MKTYRNLYKKLYSWENILLAHKKARKRKTQAPAILEFEKKLVLNLALLKYELKQQTYFPRTLTKFTLKDPKTRVICKSTYRDRIIHHALINILQPLFEPRFIHDSYASRKGFGTKSAIVRLENFVRKLSKNGKQLPTARNANDIIGFALKCDIRHYFDTVNHNILLSIIEKHVSDEKVMLLIRKILSNYEKTQGKGMPLGNWTSQFFANIYLNELDQFVKKEVKTKYYLRYVDDFLILHLSKTQLEKWKEEIQNFLQKNLCLELHPEKCKIIPLRKGIPFLGFRVFYHYKLLKRGNVQRIRRKLRTLLEADDEELIHSVFSGWKGYAKQANTYFLVKKFSQRVLIPKSKNL